MDSHGFIQRQETVRRFWYDERSMGQRGCFFGGGLGSKFADSWTKKWQWCKKFLPWTQQQLNTQQPASHANGQTTCLTQILSNMIDCPGQPLLKLDFAVQHWAVDHWGSIWVANDITIRGVPRFLDHLPGGGFLSTLTPLENSWITMVLAGWLQAGNSQAFLRHWSWDPCLHPHHRPQVIAFETCIHTWHWFNSLQMGV